MNPTKSTKEKIKEMLLSGQVLTSCGAAQDFITADLRKYISDLKKEGFDIVGNRVTSSQGKSYKEYRLRVEGEDQSAQPVPVVPIPDPVAPPPFSPASMPEYQNKQLPLFS